MKRIESATRGAELVSEQDLNREFEARGLTVSAHLLSGWSEVPSHLHAEAATIVVLAGRLVVRADGESVELSVGEGVVLDPSEKHALEARSRPTRFLLARESVEEPLPAHSGVRILLLALWLFLSNAWILALFGWSPAGVVVSGALLAILPQLLAWLPGGAQESVDALFKRLLVRTISTRSLATLWSLFLLVGSLLSGVELVSGGRASDVSVTPGRGAWRFGGACEEQKLGDGESLLCHFLVNPFAAKAHVESKGHESLPVAVRPWRLQVVDLEAELVPRPGILIRIGHGAYRNKGRLEIVDLDPETPSSKQLLMEDLPESKTAYYLGPGLTITPWMLDDWKWELERFRLTAGGAYSKEIEQENREELSETLLAWRRPRVVESLQPLRNSMKVQVRLLSDPPEGAGRGETLSCLEHRLTAAPAQDLLLRQGIDQCG